VTRPALTALAICAVAAALEGLFAGRGTRRHLEQLRQPRYSPPFGLWVGIGLCYYAICYVLLVRLLSMPLSSLWRATFATLIALMVGNAGWNLVFFRLKDLEASVAVMIVYAGLASILAVLIGLLDPASMWVFSPYLLYLAYAIWWVLSLRRLNGKVPTPEG
jgi:tryptophan-rich sensory protein